MANIDTYLQAILDAVYGEDVRGSIHDAIELINDVGEVVLTLGTAVTSASSSVEGYYENSVYINTQTWDVWKCTGTAWTNAGNIKGDKGDTGNPGIAATIAVGSVTKGENASVVNSGTNTAAIFDFVLPKGDPGPAGTYTAGTGIDINGSTISVDSDATPTENSQKPVKSGGVYDAITDVYGVMGANGAKNRLAPMTLAEIKAINTTGTWNENAYTINGVTYTCNFDSHGSLLSISESGTASAGASLYLKTFSGIEGQFYLSGGVSNDKLITFKKNGSWSGIEAKGSDVLFSAVSSDTIDVVLSTASGQTGNATFYPMIRSIADPDKTYQPPCMTNKELTESTQELKYRVGILSIPVPSYVANATPVRKKNITDDWFNGTLRAEIAAGNFKNVVPGDFIKSGDTEFWVAACDGRIGKGDQTNASNYPIFNTHHLQVIIKYLGSTSLWLGKGAADGSWQVSANDKGRCPWNAATDADPTSTTAVGSNNTNITRQYGGNNVSGYMGSFIRERIDAVILPYIQGIFGSANVLKYREIHGNAVATDKPSGGQGNWNGCTSGWAWYDRYLDLPSEVELYGSRIFGSGMDQGIQCEQLPIFKNASIQDIFGRLDIWTKAVANSFTAGLRSGNGHASNSNAGVAYWACPLACIK